MKADMLVRLRAIARGERSAVTPLPPVTATSRLRPKPAELRWLQGLQVKNDGRESENSEGRTGGAGELADAIEERAGLAADRVPLAYLDAWARLNHQKPFDASEAEWRLALNDGGDFSTPGEAKQRACAGRPASFSTCARDLSGDLLASMSKPSERITFD